jgi:phosphoribosylanthranilate isomerase
MTKVKICGITNLKDARHAVACGADFLGFVFYPLSPRFISPQKAREIIQALPRSIEAVGVFVNEDPVEVKRVAKYCGLGLIQLHGDESPGYLKRLKSRSVLKALRIKDRIPWVKIRSYGKVMFLFDTYQKNLFGGTGKSFQWEILKSLKKKSIKFIVSGGLRPENVKELVSNIRPFAVDVSSGVESKPGKKDKLLVKKFIKAVKGE